MVFVPPKAGSGWRILLFYLRVVRLSSKLMDYTDIFTSGSYTLGYQCRPKVPLDGRTDSDSAM